MTGASIKIARDTMIFGPLCKKIFRKESEYRKSGRVCVEKIKK